MKYLETNLTKEMKDLYTENDKLLLKEIEDDLNTWKKTFYISMDWKTLLR